MVFEHPLAQLLLRPCRQHSFIQLSILRGAGSKSESKGVAFCKLWSQSRSQIDLEVGALFGSRSWKIINILPAFLYLLQKHRAFLIQKHVFHILYDVYTLLNESYTHNNFGSGVGAGVLIPSPRSGTYQSARGRGGSRSRKRHNTWVGVK